jgi:hypothetical protein
MKASNRGLEHRKGVSKAREVLTCRHFADGALRCDGGRGPIFYKYKSHWRS